MRGYVSRRCSLLILKDGMKKRIVLFSCYLLELIEKVHFIIGLSRGKIQGIGYRG
jgi:hypothetical protein